MIDHKSCNKIKLFFLKEMIEQMNILQKRRQSSIVEFNRHRSTNSATLITNDSKVNKIRHTLCSYFILSLGYCDLLICLLIMPVSLVIESGYLHQYITHLLMSSTNFYSGLSCKISFYLVQIPLVLEIEILLTIAIDRYSSVFNPIKIYFFGRNKSKLALLSQVLFSCLLCIPNLFFYSSIDVGR